MISGIAAGEPFMKTRAMLMGVIVLLMATGCASSTRTVRVAVPPRVDLASFPMVGLVTFSSNSKGELDRLSTDHFLQAVQAAQPGTRVVELGTEQQVLASVKRNTWDATTLRALKEMHGVDAIVMGRLDVKKAKADVNLSANSLFKAMNVRQDVDASLTTRLLEAGTGATMWSDSSQVRANLANASFNSRGEGHFGATDAEAAYGEMVQGLVHHVTDDFRVHYVTRRVRKDDPAYANIAD
jgi:hypothetical protein